jgi:chromosomal replication initiation ATPase DnaA
MTKELKIEIIIRIVCAELAVSPNDLKRRTRLRIIVNARKIAAHLIFSHVKIGANRVGEVFGKGHSEAIYWRKQAENHIETDREFRMHYKICRDAYRQAVKQIRRKAA